MLDTDRSAVHSRNIMPTAFPSHWKKLQPSSCQLLGQSGTRSCHKTTPCAISDDNVGMHYDNSHLHWTPVHIIRVYSSLSSPTECDITAARSGTTAWWRSVIDLWRKRGVQRSNRYCLLAYQGKWRPLYRMGKYHTITDMLHSCALHLLVK